MMVVCGMSIDVFFIKIIATMSGGKTVIHKYTKKP
jgi:hypothetical protein